MPSSVGPASTTGLRSSGLQIEPKNNPDWVINEYLTTQIDIPLVIAGDSPFPSTYVRQLMTDNPRVRFMGRTNGQLHKALLTNASLYIHGHEIGGTNPSLLEAMGAGCPILALDVEFNREVLALRSACYKRSGDLAQALESAGEM